LVLNPFIKCLITSFNELERKNHKKEKLIFENL